MMGNQWVLGFNLVFLSMFLVVTKYTCLGALNSTRSCHERERLALLKFKRSIQDDHGMLSSWGVGSDCCSWKGVHCDGATGSVVSLLLRGNYSPNDLQEEYYLVGDKVNAYLAELRHLQHLDLSGNYFKGSQIPKFFGSFQQLRYLNLSNAVFSGIIPHHIGNLSNLKVLDLGASNFKMLRSNDMTWVSGLSSLEHLDLSGVSFSEANNVDRVFYMIPSLTYLSLQSCGLTNVDLGLLHLNSSKILPNIEHLDLGFNHFEGQITHIFQNMTSLTFLDLSFYNLSLPQNSASLLHMIPSLSELHLSGCGLHNAFFSPTHFNFSAHFHIQYLDLSDNSIGGRFPSELMNITFLEVLDLSDNNLNSSIPVMPNILKLDVSDNNFENIELVGIWRQCHLKELSLSFNHFGGEMLGLSSNTSECTHYALEVLEAGLNELNGSLSESIGKLNNLRVLILSSNRFTGSIPKALERLTGLTQLSLSSNLLTGPIPVSIGQLNKLIALDVSNNSLEGVVSEAHFANLSMLKWLDTSANHKLIFNISNEWMPPFQLKLLQLSSCKIVNGFPQWLQNQRKLEKLGLSNASLYGLLPTWWQNMPMLSALDLSHNKLTGSLINLPFSRYIEFLVLQNNLLNGSIPRSVCRTTSLKILDVSSNRLSGNIPDCLENLQVIDMLILSSNGLSGVLPSSFGNISSSLRWLQLNDNNFDGQFPRNLGQLSYLEVLDLGNNGFSGNIPKWIGRRLSELRILRLHKNNFTGGIPHSLCKCSQLHILDIAQNNLTGSIPHCLGELSWMIEATDEDYIESEQSTVIQVMKGFELEYTTTISLVVNMDLSSNKLTGEIPPEITALASLMGLNLSHNHLSGRIPYSIGNMKALTSLDFSDNQLNGTIPPSMAALNFLSSLNVSHNNLSGRIPSGTQLQTLTDPSIYADNKDLCGAPLPNNCSNLENPPITISKNTHKIANGPKNVWFYLDITSGFATGFWGIIGVLSFKKQWRRKLFMIAEVTMDKVFVAVAVKISKIKRGREAK